MQGKEKSMIEIRNIIHRLRLNQSQRLISRECNVCRTIVNKVYKVAVANQWLDCQLPIPNDLEISSKWLYKSKNRKHKLDAYKSEIEQWHNEGLSSIVICQLLKNKCDCDQQSIRRYRKKNFKKPIDPVMVRSTIPGRDLELDFGELGKFLDEDEQLRRVWLFSLRLRHSRKTYREIVVNQNINTFLIGHVRAFEYFNGVPTNCIHDNLKAAVTKSTIDNDMINSSYQGLAEYYGFVISPCLPRTPNHKGGVEGDIKYTKQNFIKYFLAKQKLMGVLKPTISDLRKELDIWSREVADNHIIHGVGRTPDEIFQSEELKALKPLPKTRWEPTFWSQCIVRKEWRIMIDSAYYSVPYKLIGEKVYVCMTSSLVRIFHNNQEVALHTKASKKWEYQRKTDHAPPFHEAVLHCTSQGLIKLAQEIGDFTYKLAETILSHSSIDKLRPVRCILKLAEQYSKERLEKACERAYNCKLYTYRSVKSILVNKLEYSPIEDNTPSQVPSQTSRFLRDPKDYNIEDKDEESFEEKLDRHHPFSKNGNAMMGVFQSLQADKIMDEYVHNK